MDRHFVIVGAGHAGGCAAQALRNAGHGGPITLIGEENSPPSERPPLSKELLAGIVPVEKTYLRPRDYYAGVGIDLRLGSGVAIIDRKEQRLTLADGSKVPYDSLLLTTGARARRLTLAGSDRPQVLYLRDIEDALRLRER